MLARAKELVAKAKKQAEMNLSMFGYDDADKVAYAQGVVDGIDSAMKEIVVEPFCTEMLVRIVYLSDGSVQHVYFARLVDNLPFKLSKGDSVNIEGDAFTASLFVHSVVVKLHIRTNSVVFDRLVVSIPSRVASHEQEMASLAALGWMVRKVPVEDGDKSPW